MKQLLHLLRANATPPDRLIAERDWIVDVSTESPLLLPHGSPPLPPGSLTFDELHRLLTTADLIVTW